MRRIIIILGLLSGPAMAADQFDLVCRARQVQEHYRVDLTNEQWCAGDCDRIRDIIDISPEEIVLDDHEPTFGGDYRGWIRVDRASGYWTWYNSGTQGVGRLDVNGMCKIAPYSGIAPPER